MPSELAVSRLADLTTLRLGGPAGRVVTATTEAEVVAAVQAADESGEQLLVLGGGSNVVIGDDGWPGTVLLVRTAGIDQADGCGASLVMAQAGETWDDLVAECVSGQLAGVECISGVPGSVGATPIQNVGAYGQEVSDVIERVRALDRRSGEVVELGPLQCGFSYRSSMFKRNPERYVVLAVAFRLERSPQSRPIKYPELARRLGIGVGDRSGLSEVRDTVLQLRRWKGMVLDPVDHDTWSAGSFFTNPVVPPEVAERLPEDAPRFWTSGGYKVSAAWLIEAAGFDKGFRIPGDGASVSLSTKHTLALTNRGSATTADLLALARTVRAGVADRFGITLAPEPVLISCSL